MSTLHARAVLLRSSTLLALALACGGGPASTSNTTSGDDSTSSSGGDAGSTGLGSTTDAPTTGGESSSTTPSSSSSSGTTTGSETGSSSSGETSTTSGTSTGDTTGDTSTGGTTSGTSTGDTTGDTGTGGTTTTGGPDGLGEISGDCGLIDAMELDSPDAFVFTGAIDFGVVGFDYDMLTPGGQQMYDAGNLNAGSLESEVVAFEVLARCEMAQLLKTEGTIVYSDPMGKKTDILVDMDGMKVGVSVVRAVGFPKDDPYTVAQAKAILDKKLSDILISSANVAPEDAWVKQILSVVAYSPMHIDSLLTAYAQVDPAVKADTILVITATNGDDVFIYD